LNRFEYLSGTSPSIVDFELQIGFTLINGQKIGDVITFDNVAYEIPIASFSNNSNLISFKTQAIKINNDAFYSCISLIEIDISQCTDLLGMADDDQFTGIYGNNIQLIINSTIINDANIQSLISNNNTTVTIV